ncbi:MAG TPA: hemolysin family protein [Rhodothermales bacterium]|nr:hemolysin family protein [Rhodothermales bacterium]HRR07682.1 hemolysin family protein [Rhodothermales bacterium]
MFHKTKDLPSPALDDPYPSAYLDWAIFSVATPWCFFLEITAFVTLLIVSALLSGAEVAFLSLSDREKRRLTEDSSTLHRRILHLVTTPGETLTSILTINTLANVALVLLGTEITRQFALRQGIPPEWSLFVEVILLALLLVAFAEIIPKMLAHHYAHAYCRLMSLPVYWAVRLSAPFGRLLAPLSSRINERMDYSNGGLTAEDLKYLADIGEKHGTILAMERDMIHSIAEFNETTVRDVMTSRLDVVALSTDLSFSQVLDLVREHGYSRYPLYESNLDQIVGLVYAKDFLPLMNNAPLPDKVDWQKLMRPEPLYVPESKKISNLLEEFRQKRLHMAIVIDEHGGTEGLVTMEDILEEIVGDIRDELDDEEEILFRKTEKGAFLVGGRMHIDDLQAEIPFTFEEEEDIQTVAGLFLHRFGDFPQEGDFIALDHLKMTVKKITKHRIDEVLIELLTETTTPE